MSPLASPDQAGTVYANAGNPEALAFIPSTARRVLDVGCGAGDNARLLSSRGIQVAGVTLSHAEAAIASPFCRDVAVADLEKDSLPFDDHGFDVLLLSHVLEHLKSPRDTLRRLARYLVPGGIAIVAVPNMAHWRLRLALLRGDWRRHDTGPFDRTHLHFWSYLTAPAIFDGTPFTLQRVEPGGLAIPLQPLRRIMPSACAKLDRWIGLAIPNFAAVQVLLVALKTTA